MLHSKLPLVTSLGIIYQRTVTFLVNLAAMKKKNMPKSFIVKDIQACELAKSLE